MTPLGARAVRSRKPRAEGLLGAGTVPFLDLGVGFMKFSKFLKRHQASHL